MSNSLRFVGPADSRRPNKARRFDVWSPKIGRQLKLFGERALSTWIAIEADPTITGFCERPVVRSERSQSRVLDFWVHSGTREELWLLLRPREVATLRQHPEHFQGLESWADGQGMHVRYFESEHRMLCIQAEANWSRILPYLTANRDLVTAELVRALLDACESDMSLRQLETRLHGEDPVVVRTGIFSLLHRGALIAPTLSSTRLCGDTQVRRA